jgi:hypothetical protein
MSLANLSAFAVANNNTTARAKQLSELSIEEARAKVKVRDGNRKPSVDGSVALTLVLGKKTLSLDVIAPAATRVNATVDQIQEFTTILQDAIAAGNFDNEIIRIQKESVKVPEVAPVAPSEETSTQAAEPAKTEVPAGVDLNELS